MRLTLALAAVLLAQAAAAPTTDLPSPFHKAPVTHATVKHFRQNLWKPAIPDVADCIAATNQLKHAEIYAQPSTVTFRTCSLSCDGASDIDGEEQETTAKAAIVAVVRACKSHQGTYSAGGLEISVKKPVVRDDD